MLILMYLLIGSIMAGMLCFLPARNAASPYFLFIALTWLPLFLTGACWLSFTSHDLVRID
ncbi:hypothetical protein LC040_02585 [Bacillus tianshenii]|nr:hypothetical protein LC040_02585 [Bacillus tianshenii]